MPARPNAAPGRGYDVVTGGRVLWEVDGRRGRSDSLTYRESYRATYQGPYTKGKQTAWDGLVSNRDGMVTSDPERGFVLTMKAGEAVAGSYTTRDIASAPHGVDYSPHYRDWERDAEAHPNLLMPGRTAVYQGVRFEALALGDELRGTGGCCAQDWLGLDFETMALHGNRAASQYSGIGICWLPRSSMLPRLARLALPFVRDKGPFSTPRPGVAPLYAMMARTKGFVKARVLHVDPWVPHDIAIHWTPDAKAIEAWVDGERVLRVDDRERAVPAGWRTRGRARFSRSGFHACCWQDNGSGNPDVQGVAGHPATDQPFSVTRLAIVDAR